MHDGREPFPTRPPGTSDLEVEAAGKASEVLEWIERARGHLYEFHQLMGHADLLLDEVVELLERASRPDLADLVREELVGRNVLDGRWTFQVVDEFDDGYYAIARATERALRDALTGGRRHVFEAELKERRRSTGRTGHERQPPGRWAPAEAL